MRTLIACLVVICCTLAPALVNAGQTRWVSDQLPLDMRSGNSNGYRVIKMLTPGTKVTVLQVDKQAQFSEVVTEDGTKGWLTNRYLMNEPSGREKLAKAEAAIAQLRQGKEPLVITIEELKAQNATLTEQLDQVRTGRDSAERELTQIRDLSANAMALDQSNQALMESNQLLQHEIDVLKGENSRLKDGSNQAWFLKGALAVVLGAVLALAIPRISPSRKNSEWR